MPALSPATSPRKGAACTPLPANARSVTSCTPNTRSASRPSACTLPCGAVRDRSITGSVLPCRFIRPATAGGASGSRLSSISGSTRCTTPRRSP
eukprot:gene25810-32303_t